MSLSTTPAPARTDAPAGPRAPARTDAPAGSGAGAGGTTWLVRRAGFAVVAGAGSWAVACAALGTTPPAGTWPATVVNLTAFAFQVGLAFLVTAQLRTGAIGTGRLARGLLHVEHGLLAVAMVSSLMWALTPGLYDTTAFLVLDVFWPLSMLGMAAIGVRIAIAGRWRGAARFWPAVAESWGPVVVPTAFLLPTVTQYVGAAHLLLGYVALGLVLVLRPELTGARD